MPADPQRVKYARNALAAYRVIKNKGRTDEADARDLIADIFHMLYSEGCDVHAEVRMALNNFTDEVNIARFEVRRAV